LHVKENIVKDKDKVRVKDKDKVRVKDKDKDKV